MKELQEALKTDYSEKMSSLKFSDKRKLYKLYQEPKHTTVLRKIVACQIAMAVLILACAGTATAAVRNSMKEIIAEKTQPYGISEEKTNEMAERLESNNIVPESIEKATDSIILPVITNRYGETTGKITMGTDLIAVDADENGEEFTGYCYFDDFMEVTGISSKTTTRNWIYVYDFDAVNVIGKWVNGSFVSNSQLENPDLSISIVDGNDVDEYETMAQNRIAEKLAK